MSKNKSNRSFRNAASFLGALLVLTLVFFTSESRAIGFIKAQFDTTYTVNYENTEEEASGVYLSSEYQYDNVFGTVNLLDNFNDAQVFFQQLNNNTMYEFTFSRVSGKVLEPTATFGKLKLSVKMLNDLEIEKVFLRFNAPNGIYNVDMLRNMQAFFSDISSSFMAEISVLGDQFGMIRRYMNCFELELNLSYIFQAIQSTELFIIIYSEDSPVDPTPLVDYRWIDVDYPSSFSMKLESDSTFDRYFTIGFPGQTPRNYMLYQSARFMLTEVRNIRVEDIVDPYLKSSEIVILKSYLFEADRGLIVNGSFIKYDYMYSDLTDLAGEQVEIKFDTVTCASTFGQGYSYGQPIKPGEQSFDAPGRVTCTDSVLVPNSLVVIYAKVVMYKRPSVDRLTNGEKVESQVSSGFGKYANIGNISPSTCVTFRGSVSNNPLSIYMLQQELTKNRDLASNNYYTSVVTLPVGENLEAKFCSNETYFKTVRAQQQEMDFSFFAANPETTSEFTLTSTIGDGRDVAGTVVGILFAIGIVFGLSGALTVGIIYWWRKKRANYSSINDN